MHERSSTRKKLFGGRFGDVTSSLLVVADHWKQSCRSETGSENPKFDNLRSKMSLGSWIFTYLGFSGPVSERHDCFQWSATTNSEPVASPNLPLINFLRVDDLSCTYTRNSKIVRLVKIQDPKLILDLRSWFFRFSRARFHTNASLKWTANGA